MKYCATLLLCLMTAINAVPAPVEQPSASVSVSPATLRWNNGETLTGELAGASASSLTWETPLFGDPVLLGWDAVHRIDRAVAAVPVTDPFGFVLKDGSYLYGDLVSITGDSVTIRSARHGDAVLKRSEVLRMRRIRGGDLVFGGPVGDGGWKPQPNEGSHFSIETNPDVPALTGGPGGSLLMPYWNRSASLDVALPEVVDVEFRVRSSARPDFVLSLKNTSGQHVRVETWDDELVIAASDRFKAIRKIAENERDIALRLCWDGKAGKCSVFTPEGEKLTEWQVPQEKEGPHSGLVLQNKGRDLSLDFVRVRPWDGKPPSKIDGKQPRIELTGGKVVEGEIATSSADSIALRARGGDSAPNIALKEVDAVIFSADPPRATEHEATFSYADGTILMGKILAIKEGSAAIATSFTKAPLASRLDALRQLMIKAPPPDGAAPESPLAALDTLAIQETTLHGKFVGGEDDSPRWLPVGGVHPVRLSKNLPSEISRAFPKDTRFPTAPALFYTGMGDVLPGTLHGLDKAGVEFESGVVEVTKMAADDLDAIQFGAAARVNLQGFDDPGWRILKGDEKTVRRENGSLHMEPETSLYHPVAMQGGEIKFMVDPGSAFRLRLFCSGADGAKSSNLILWNLGSQVICGMESTEGQVGNQFQTKIQASPVAVRLVILEKQVELCLNGAPIQKFPIGPAKRMGTGLIIEPTSLWGNRSNSIALSKFSATSAPGCPSLPDVSAETKTQALTIPRFRKDDPPRHVLLAANGDLLRGEVEAITAKHLAFRSGLENLSVPLERVQAVIWLKKALESDAVPVAANNKRKLLDETIGDQVRYTRAGVSSFINFLESQAPGLKFKLPKEEPNRQFAMQFGGQTIGEALDEICSMAGLQYRLGDDGTIILEAASKTSASLVQKVYWLKAGAFPTGASAQEILAQKGISFPPGAAASWNPAARQLAMTNSAENHGKLMEVLAADFGGSLGSPTHWLLLTNGARLGIAVDKFGKDSISGHHPVYGRCNVPISEIYGIRTSMPEPSTVMKSLAGWRLAFAPEPVLPESSGESSPSLGKEAKPFKLPLLGGGDFDLSLEKGKVIVLDFWATWCGPCVRSLPGLIEAVSTLPADRVKLIGVNQSEPDQQVKRFLETRGWKLTVAMDAGQSVGRLYGVDAIPHTVVIGPDGKIAWVKVGYSPDAEAELKDAVKRLLEAPKETASP